MKEPGVVCARSPLARLEVRSCILYHRWGFLPSLLLSLPHLVGAVDVEYTIEVINFVLEDASQPTLGFKPEWFVSSVAAFDRHCLVAIDLTKITWQG